MKLIKYLFIFFLSNNSFSQVTRTILNRGSNAPVPFATIKILHTQKGEIASDRGQFRINIEPADTIQITSVGYQTKTICGKDISSIIYLEPQVQAMQGVTVKAMIPVDTILLGNGKDLINTALKCRYDEKGAHDDCWPWGPANKSEEFAEKILLPDSLKIYKINKLYIPTKLFEKTGTLLVRIYLEDSVTGLPGEEIFRKLYDVSSKSISKNKFVAAVSHENIFITGSKAFFISVGWPQGEFYKTWKFASINFFKTNSQNTFTRNLLSASYSWFPFNFIGDGTKVGTLYAVELEERVY